jgi:hypothetical protein
MQTNTKQKQNPMINGQKYEVSVKHESFHVIKATFTPLDKDRNTLPNIRLQTFEVKSSGVIENEKSKYENFETQVKKEHAMREAVTEYEEALKEVRIYVSADPGIQISIGNQLGVQFSELMTIFQNRKTSEQTKGEIRGLFRKPSKEVLNSKNLQLINLMSDAICNM